MLWGRPRRTSHRSPTTVPRPLSIRFRGRRHGRTRGGPHCAVPLQGRDLAVAEAVRRAGVDPGEVEEVYLGCANQAGEDNRNLARMAGLLAGLPDSSGGVTLNRLCGSGLDAVAMAARAIRGGESDLVIAGDATLMTEPNHMM